MMVLNRIVGQARDPEIAERLHRLEHRGRVERVRLAGEDLRRHRLRAATDAGTECAIALPRDCHLADGSVLLLEEDRAIVVAALQQRTLRLVPRDAAAALELGYFAGNMHWSVRFDGAALEIVLSGSAEAYLERLQHLLADGRIRLDEP
jgi:urease accessory protein